MVSKLAEVKKTKNERFARALVVSFYFTLIFFFFLVWGGGGGLNSPSPTVARALIMIFFKSYFYIFIPIKSTGQQFVSYAMENL